MHDRRRQQLPSRLELKLHTRGQLSRQTIRAVGHGINNNTFFLHLPMISCLIYKNRLENRIVVVC